MLFSTAVVSGGMLLWPLVSRASAGNLKQVSAVEAVQLINRRDAVIIDLRDTGAYAAGHIPNARNLPFSQLTDRLKEVDKFKSRPIVVYGPTVSHAAKACAALTNAGVTEAVALRGGLGGWTEASLPVEK